MSRATSIMLTIAGAIIDLATVVFILISGLTLLGVGSIFGSFWVSAGLAIGSFAVGQVLNLIVGSEYQRWGAGIRDHLFKKRH